MRGFLSFTCIFASSMAAYFAGFIWWVPLIGTLALFSTSTVWSQARRIYDAGILRGALPIYAESLLNSAIAICGASAVGYAVKMMSHF